MIVIDCLASLFEIKHGYGSHRQQPQNHGQYDELDPFLVVEEPSMMHGTHGEPPYGPIQPNTLSHLRADVPGLHLTAVLGHDPPNENGRSRPRPCHYPTPTGLPYQVEGGDHRFVKG